MFGVLFNSFAMKSKPWCITHVPKIRESQSILSPGSITNHPDQACTAQQNHITEPGIYPRLAGSVITLIVLLITYTTRTAYSIDCLSFISLAHNQVHYEGSMLGK